MKAKRTNKKFRIAPLTFCGDCGRRSKEAWKSMRVRFVESPCRSGEFFNCASCLEDFRGVAKRTDKALASDLERK